MRLDYSLLLDNIKGRRYDETTKNHVLSASFYDENLPKSVRYTMESMQKIDTSYAYKVFSNASKINKSIDAELVSKGIDVMVRYQGELRIETHIELYGEVDVLYILNDTANHKDVQELGKIILNNLAKQNLQCIDFGDGGHIQLVAKKPTCKINIVPCVWINNPQFVETKNEIYRGIAVYNFKDKTRKKYLPFLNMARINLKDNTTMGNYKKLVRLINSLSIDESIALHPYDLTSLFYRLDNDHLMTENHKYMAFLPRALDYLKSLLDDKEKLEQLVSPSKKELVFGKHSEKREAIKKLYDSLLELINNLKEVIGENLDEPIEYSFDPPA